MSNLIDILLRPLTKRVKSYLRDTTDFLNHLPSAEPENTLLASFDVESLYSNIQHELGIEAIKYWLRKYPNDTPSRFPKLFTIEGIEFILKKITHFVLMRTIIVKRTELLWGQNLRLFMQP